MKTTILKKIGKTIAEIYITLIEIFIGAQIGLWIAINHIEQGFFIIPAAIGGFLIVRLIREIIQHMIFNNKPKNKTDTNNTPRRT